MRHDKDTCAARGERHDELFPMIQIIGSSDRSVDDLRIVSAFAENPQGKVERRAVVALHPL